MATRVGDGSSAGSVRSVGIEPHRSRDAKRGQRIAIVATVGFLLLLGGAYAYDRAGADHYFPQTRIGGVEVGSLTERQASDLLTDRFVAPLREPMKLTAPQFATRRTPWEMGMRVDVRDAARDALVRQRDEGVVARLWHRVFGDPANVRVEPTVNDAVFADFLEKTFNRIDRDPQDARIEIAGDELKLFSHKVGRKVDKKAAEDRIFAALTDRKPEIEIPVDVVQPELRDEHFDRVLLISTGSNRLTLYKEGKVGKRYAVATGTGGHPTPHGQFRITAKRMNPTWYNPYSEWSMSMPAFIPPGPNNPLGTRALNLNASGIRIHGTPDAASIGTNASHGCIRMLMSDAEDLFERVDVGTPVLIVG